MTQGQREGGDELVAGEKSQRDFSLMAKDAFVLFFHVFVVQKEVPFLKK